MARINRVSGLESMSTRLYRGLGRAARLTGAGMGSAARQAGSGIGSAAGGLGRFYIRNKHVIDNLVFDAAALSAFTEGISYFSGAPFSTSALAASVSTAYSAGIDRIAHFAENWGHRAVAATYAAGLAASVPIMHGIFNLQGILNHEQSLDFNFLKDAFLKSPYYAAVVALSYLGYLTLHGAFTATQPEEFDSSKREFLKQAGTTALGVLGLSLFARQAYKMYLDSNNEGLTQKPKDGSKPETPNQNGGDTNGQEPDYPKNPNRYEDLNTGILLSKRTGSVLDEIIDDEIIDTEVLTKNKKFAGKQLTVRYFMLDSAHGIPKDGSESFYDNLIYLGERDDLEINSEGKGDLEGIFQFDKDIEAVFSEGTALINPMAHERARTGKFNLLVEIWNGEKKLDHKWWGKDEKAYELKFRRYEEEPETPERPVERVPTTGRRKVFVYDQTLSRKMTAESMAVADYWHPHLYEIKLNKKGHLVLKQRCNNSTLERIVRLARENNIKVVPMVSIFDERGRNNNLVRTVLNNQYGVASLIADTIKQQGFDGVAIDVESMRVDAGYSSQYVEFIRKLRGKLPQQEICVPVSPRFEGSAENGFSHHGFYDFEGLSKYADYIQIMAYDFHKKRGRPKIGAILPGEMIDPIVQYAQAHIPNDKIVFLMPAWGHAWTTGGYSVGVISCRQNERYLEHASSTDYSSGELRIKTRMQIGSNWQGRVATTQDGKVYQRRLDEMSDHAIESVGIWRSSHASPEILGELGKWKQGA